MNMKLLMLLLIFVSLSFAAGPPNWQTYAMIATFSALGVLIILFLFGYFLDSTEMRVLAQQEIYQVIISMFFIAAFFSLQFMLDSYIAGPLAQTFGQTTLMGAAMDISKGISSFQWGALSDVSNKLAVPLGSLSSMGASCSFLGTSLSYPGCVGIQVPFSSVSFAMNAMAGSLLIQNSQVALLYLAQNFFFPILFPLGLFLRCFQFTRGAGGFLIAFSFSFYFIYPVSIIVTKGMADLASSSEIDGNPIGDISYPTIHAPNEFFDASDVFSLEEGDSDCNPLDLDTSYTTNQVKHVLAHDLVYPLLFQFFIGGLFTTMLNILIALSAVRGLSAMFGAEVDLSALAKIA